MFYNETKLVKLPTIKDPDNDLYTVKVDMQKAGSFVSWVKSSLQLYLHPKITDVGSYTITITLTDVSAMPLSKSYTLSIKVKGKDGSLIPPSP